MAKLKILKDTELVGGTDNTDVYPVTSTQALYSHYKDGLGNLHVRMRDGEPEKLEDRLEDQEAAVGKFENKVEKLAVYLSNNKSGSTLEITGTANSMTLSGSAQLETYGDYPSEAVPADKMDSKKMTVKRNEETVYDENVVSATVEVPDVVGTYVSTFSCTYNGVTKTVSSTTYVNLRKYFGFATSQPTDPTTLGTSHFSNTVGCTITVPAISSSFQYIYFAVPSGMTISNITQPDSLNAPLAFTQIGTINRVIGTTTYTYKLYRSNDLIDSANSKRLTIS